MNDQFDPIDPVIREHLTRRSAGPLPVGLDAQVARAIDGAAPQSRFGWPGLRLTLPRLAGAAVAVAFVAVLVVALVAPALRGGPAASTGYPYDRAMSADQLAAWLAGPTPATNTAFIATVTIEVKLDVCPMNRYPTLGVIQDMGRQVCVMSTIAADYAVGSKMSGTYAFRYLGGFGGETYLGLIDRMTPAPSRLAFKVTDAWPTDGKPFVVEGYLGAYPQTCLSIYSLPNPGDVLDPSGGDPCFQSWLSEDGLPPPFFYFALDGGAEGSGGGPATTEIPANGVATPSTRPTVQPRLSAPESTTPYFDALALYGKTRYVEAGGVRQFDSVTHDTTYGAWVVKPVTSGCAGASVIDSRGCTVWRVLARVDDVLSDSPSVSPSAAPTTPSTATESPSPIAPATPIASQSGPVGMAPTGLIGADNRPLTPTQVAALIAADKNHLAGRYVIDERAICDGVDCSGAPTRALADLIQPDGSIGLVGPLDVRPDGGIVWTIPQAISSGSGGLDGRFIFILDATMLQIGDTTVLNSDAGAEWEVQADDFSRFSPPGLPTSGTSFHGFFLVRRIDYGKGCPNPTAAPAGACKPQIEILARLEAA